MDHRHFKQFARAERRQQRRQPRRQHRFSGSRRAVHQQVVAAGGRDLERAFGRLLPFDVGQIGQTGAGRAHRRLRPRHHLRSLEMIGELDQRARRENIDVGRRPGCLRPAFMRADEPVAARVGRDRRRQRAGHRRDRAVERQLAEHGETLQRVGGDRAGGGHDAERDRQVVMAAFLRQVGRREIDGDAPGRQRQTRGDERGAHPLARFRHRLVAEPDHVEHDLAARNLHLNVDRTRLNALERHRCHPDDHRPRLLICAIMRAHSQKNKNTSRTFFDRQKVIAPIGIFSLATVAQGAQSG
jgi:hypothetical protein